MLFTELLTPRSKEIFLANFPRLKSEGAASNVELEIVTKNGKSLYLIVNATAIRDSYGNFIKSRATVFDMTDRHLAEEKVIAINNELEAFTYSVSHDLRAPLRSIDGYSKILQEDYGNKMDGESNRILDIIRNNARRMGQLIDDLLDFSRLGRKELEKSTVNMNSLVTNVKQELLAQERDRNIQFTINRLDEVDGDARMMRQVWINLISNAIKYSRKQQLATIEIGSTAETDRVTYFIRDNGVGFDMKYADKLFGVFQRLHKMQEFEGTGVGLALVHRIVSRHGGKVWAEARVNQGATFFFFIPT
jgi:light-regulated signal transduction histidine kinase (bacteriophytochrome)